MLPSGKFFRFALAVASLLTGLLILFGMAREAILLGAVEEVLPLHRIPQAMLLHSEPQKR